MTSCWNTPLFLLISSMSMSLTTYERLSTSVRLENGNVSFLAGHNWIIYINIVGFTERVEVPLVKCCLERDDKAAWAEATDGGPYEGAPQLTLVVGGIYLKSTKSKMFFFLPYMQWVAKVSKKLKVYKLNKNSTYHISVLFLFCFVFLRILVKQSTHKVVRCDTKGSLIWHMICINRARYFQEMCHPILSDLQSGLGKSSSFGEISSYWRGTLLLKSSSK